MATKQGGARAATAAATGEAIDPKYEWIENATSFLLRVHLPGFRKEDFRVQVDAAGRLTVRGERVAGGKQRRFHKAFQLPPTSNLDDISGRFEASVLTLTVPKRAAAPPATVEEIRRPAKAEADEARRPRQEEIKKQEEVDAKRSKQEPEKKAAAPAVRKEEEKAPKAEAAAAGPTEKKPAPPEDKAAAPAVRKEEEKPKAEAAVAAPPEAKTAAPAVRKEEEKPKAEAAAAAATEKKQAPPEATAVGGETLAERVRRRRAEEERGKAAAEEAEREGRRRAACGGWKERVTAELEGIAGSEWAEGLVETVKRNKEVIAAIAALSVGLYVSSKLFSRN
ncbi:hypothetical protein ACP4OV_021353 [Aristida adscensionis]